MPFLPLPSHAIKTFSNFFLLCHCFSPTHACTAWGRRMVHNAVAECGDSGGVIPGVPSPHCSDKVLLVQKSMYLGILIFATDFLGAVMKGRSFLKCCAMNSNVFNE